MSQVAIARTTTLVLYLSFKSLWLIWRLGTFRFQCSTIVVVMLYAIMMILWHGDIFHIGSPLGWGIHWSHMTLQRPRNTDFWCFLWCMPKHLNNYNVMVCYCTCSVFRPEIAVFLGLIRLHLPKKGAFLTPYHGYAMREVSVNSTSIYETN